MNLPNYSQTVALGRHAVTFVAGGITFAAAAQLISGDDAATLQHSLQLITGGIAQIAAGVAPIVGLVSAYYSAWSASHPSQIAAVNDIPGVKVVAQSASAPTVTAPPKV